MLFAGAGVILGGFMYWAAQRNEDPMCTELASTFDAECRKDLPAESALTAGTILDTGNGQVIGQLNSAACLVPGALSAPLPQQLRALRPDALTANIAYTALQGRGLQAVPAPPSLFLPTAAWSAVHEARVALSGLREAVLAHPHNGSSGSAASAGTDRSIVHPVADACLVAQTCATHFKDGSWRVISSTILADRVHYELLGDQAQPVAPPSAAIGRTLRADGKRWRLVGPHVVGVRYLDSASVAELASCAVPVAHIPGGHARVRIVGTGQRGAVATETMEQPLGKIALVSSRGTEVSDCNADIGRKNPTPMHRRTWIR